ncbi:MAG: hypothetical protein ACHQ50_07740 [Fimbriimonadales bacterium]
MNKLPKDLQDPDKLRDLGIAICQEIEHSETGKGSLPRRWERNEQLYNIDPDATNLNLVESMASYPIPLWKPKADRIVGTVFKSITGIEPYVQCIPDTESPGDSEKAQRLARALMTVATHDEGRYGFDRAFRQCLKTAVNTGIAVLYVHPTQDGCVEHEPIHPKDFCIYPHELGDIKKAKTVGHRFWKLRNEIKALFEAGEYLTDEVGGADSVGERGGKSSAFGRTAETPIQEPDDQLIECWQVVRRCDLGEGERDYIVCVAKKTQLVLKVAPLEYKTGRLYFDIRFDDEYGSFWPASSPGQDIQGIQLIYSDLFNVAIQGGYSAAFPGVALIGATLNAKVKRWGPGTVWELPSGASVQTVGNTFNGGFLVSLLPHIENIADATSRVSRLGTSENLPASTTATAAAGFLQAQEQGQDQFTAFVAPTVAEIFTFLREILVLHWEQIKRQHGTALGIQKRDDLTQAVRFVPTGKSSNSSPNTLLQKLQMAMGLSQNPNSTLDYQSVEKQVLQALDLPFDVTGLEKPLGPTARELTAVLAGLLNGQVSPQEALQILQEAHAATTGQTPNVGVPPNGLPAPGAGGGPPTGPAPAASGAVPGPAVG